MLANNASLKSGSTSSIELKAGQTAEIEFPVKPSHVKWIGMLKSRNDNQADLRQLDKIAIME